MANTKAYSGLVPVSYLNGARWSGQMRLYYIDSTDTNAYAIGDPVKTSTGVAASGTGISAVTLATAGTGNVIRGVLVTAGGATGNTTGAGTAGAGFYNPASMQLTVIPATKTQSYYVGVVDDPYVIFEMQEWGGASYTAFTYADVGKNTNLKSTANNGYISQWTIDTTAASAVTAAHQLRLLELAQRPGNAFGQYATWRVLINNHEFKAAVLGV
jgi:hypothetical protein